MNLTLDEQSKFFELYKILGATCDCKIIDNAQRRDFFAQYTTIRRTWRICEHDSGNVKRYE